METDTGEEMTGDRKQKRKTGSQEAKSWALGSQGLRAPEPATRWQNEPSFGTRQIWVQILTRYEALGRTHAFWVSVVSPATGRVTVGWVKTSYGKCLTADKWLLALSEGPRWLLLLVSLSGR